ncbi:MAG: YggT family protein [Fusobacterium sp.]|nr:YggT family protein [Fusobacterium sp.]
MILLFNIFSKIIFVINTLIVIRVVLSWLSPNSNNAFTDLVYNLTEPILKPFRVLLPMGNLRVDLSPMVAYIFLSILKRLVFYLLF